MTGAIRALLVIALIALVTFFTRLLPFGPVPGGKGNAAICALFGESFAFCNHCHACSILFKGNEPSDVAIRLAGADCGGGCCGVACVEEEHPVEHWRGNRVVYGIGAVCFCYIRASAPDGRGKLKRIVGEIGMMATEKLYVQMLGDFSIRRGDGKW